MRDRCGCFGRLRGARACRLASALRTILRWPLRGTLPAAALYSERGSRLPDGLLVIGWMKGEDWMMPSQSLTRSEPAASAGSPDEGRALYRFERVAEALPDPGALGEAEVA